MTNLITLKDVEYIYSSKTGIGLHSTSLSIESGKIYSLIGPNGSGKTTMLKVLTNLLSKQKGKIFYFSEEINKFHEIRKHIGYIPDSEAVWENLTCEEFIFYSCQLYNVEIDDEFQKIYSTWLKIFDLEIRKNDLLSTFSFGMKKKVQIIATLLKKPLLFILDEPVFGLDPISVELLFKIMNSYVKTTIPNVKINETVSYEEINPSIIITSHQMGYVEKYTDHILFISDGKIILSDTVQNIKGELDFKNLNDKFIQAAQKEELLNTKLNLIKKLFN